MLKNPKQKSFRFQLNKIYHFLFEILWSDGFLMSWNISKTTGYNKSYVLIKCDLILMQFRYSFTNKCHIYLRIFFILITIHISLSYRPIWTKFGTYYSLYILQRQFTVWKRPKSGHNYAYFLYDIIFNSINLFHCTVFRLKYISMRISK